MFINNDLIMFHQIVYKLISLNMPDYLKLYDGTSGLRKTHLDHLSFVSHIQYNTGVNNLNKSFFFRCHTIWNSLPLEIRKEENPKKFKTELESYLWNIALSDTNIDDSGEGSLSSSQDSD